MIAMGVIIDPDAVPTEFDRLTRMNAPSIFEDWLTYSDLSC